MKISLNWLKEYAPLDISPDEIADLLTNTGLEVEEHYPVQSIEGGLEGLVIGHVQSVEKHPDADKLVVTKVNLGNGEELQIVCGAPNVASGQKVVVATVGTTLFPIKGDSFKIKKAKIRGVESKGMICAEDEIGIGESHDGIMVLDEHAVIGTSAKEYFKVSSDHIFEIGLTPNRSDANSHIGTARDLLAAYNFLYKKDVALQLPDMSQFKSNSKQPLMPVVVENAEACPRYSGISISNITVKESPDWLKNRLKAIGLRPINNIVDITNYVLHESGQPLHAFDADKIKGGKVIVKNLKEGTKFITLDEQERKLSGEDLMICNGNSDGMCIAGVFGGLNSGVTSTTKNIFLESAYFDAVSIRKTSTRHNLRTDAATHFEKGTDPNITVDVLKRAAMLIQELGGGEIASDIVDVYPNKIQPAKVNVRFSRINLLAGISIEKDAVKRILKLLGIDVVSEENDLLKLEIPAFKSDVLREIDVIEEIIRIFGYNHIDLPEFLRTNISFSDPIQKDKEQKSFSDVLTGNGFMEIMNISISRSEYYKSDKVFQKGFVNLANSMTADLDVLRQSMIYGLLESIQHNVNRRNEDLRLFEFGKTYRKVNDGQYEEKEHLIVACTGMMVKDSWQLKKHKADFFYLKSIVENLFTKAGINNYQSNSEKSDHLSSALTYQIGKTVFATIGKINAELTKQFDIDQEVFYADIDWRFVLSQKAKNKVQFSEIPRFPYVRRDLALIIEEQITFDQIRSIANNKLKGIVKEINLFDVYRDDKIGSDKKSYAVSFIFQDENKTLTDKEVEKWMDKLIQSYESELNALIRR